MNPALGPWAEGHRENGGWAYPRKYQRAANATIDRVELSLEAVPWPGNITVQVLAVTSEQSIGIHCPSGLLPRGAVTEDLGEQGECVWCVVCGVCVVYVLFVWYVVCCVCGVLCVWCV